ncbi:MAG: photosystem I reaction center subunit XII [Leptolyngbya sp. LCM1.Bin17]|jgi:phycocyanin-associated rod protein|nr:MAG: photosystem I reaction center subunit XII [Leptolyngbya sp. LCM1.Bin17]
MLAQSAFGNQTASPSGSRVFLYEVEGLRQNDESDRNTYPIRQSGSVFIKVPYNRMNEEMQRITRLGGKIVSIQSLSNGADV